MPIAQIQENDRRERFVATAGQTVFPYDFPIYAATDLQVRRERSGVITTLTYGADYSVTGAQNQTGGNVVLTAGATLNDIIVILSAMPTARTGQFVNGGDLSAAALEAEFNRNRILIQQNYRDGRNALLFPPTDPAMQDLPPIALRANRFLAFDINGQPVAATPIAGTVLDALSRLGDNMIGRLGFLPGSAAAPGLTPNNNIASGFFSGADFVGVAINGQESTRFIPGGMQFQQIGTGAVARTAQAKMRDVVSVGDFGAVGDDVADDRPAIQAAVDYISSLPNGGELQWPKGVYRLSSAINVPNTKSLTFIGQGDATKIRLNSGAGGPILNCGSGTIYSTRLVIKSLFFQGPNSGTSKSISLQNCNTARIEDCIFQNQTIGVETTDSFAFELTGNVFDVCSLYGFIANTACHNAIIERNNFFTCQTQAIRFNVLSDNLVIDNNNFEYCGSNIRINNCTAVSIRGNYMEYQSNACFEFLGTNRNVEIEQNWIALGSGGGAIAALANIVGGGFRMNTVYNQNVTTAATLVDFEMGANYKTGTGTIAVQNWTAPSLLNSWVAQSNYMPAGYRKDENNIVHLRGNLTGGAAGTVIFTLPVGYRPANFGTFAALGSGGLAWIEIRPNGDVFTATAPSNLTGINGIQFKSEA